MAHEIGHVTLPRGSQTKAGLMKSDWDVRDLGRVDVLKLQFSEQQADQIRSTIEGESRFLAHPIAR